MKLFVSTHIVRKPSPVGGEGGFCIAKLGWGGIVKNMLSNNCIGNLHLISHFVTASPQGEALRLNNPFMGSK